jgi:hypothetical protein
MAREIINGVVWGENVATDPAELLRPSDSTIQTGWPEGKPPRQTDNWLKWHVHQNLEFIESQGVFLWDSSITYSQYAKVRFGTKHYISLQNSNTNKSPSTETAWWKDYFVWLSEQAGTEQTNQTVANFNDGYFYPHPVFVTGTTVNMTNTNILLTDLGLYPLSSTPLTITVPTTVANTWYYIYVDVPAGASVVTGDVSITTTTPTFDHSKGMFISGTKRCIGYIEGNNTGNGEAEPYLVGNGWYQRRDEKRKLALYTPSPQTNTTLYAGVPNFDGWGIAEIASYSYEEERATFAYADNTGFVGNLGDENHGWGSAPVNHQYNGQIINGITSSVSATDPSTGAAGLVMTDTSGNILVSGHNVGGAQDEAMAFWLKRFALPRGIFSV